MTERTKAPKPTVPEVMPLVHSVYRRHSAGCCWHVVLDDGNVGQTTVSWCAEQIKQGKPHWCGNLDCWQLADLLPRMSRTQVAKLAGRHA